MRDKAVENVTNELIGQVKKIQRPKDKRQAVYEIQKFNQMVEGIQNYYRLATDINIDCSKIQRMVSTTIKNRLKGRIKKHGIIGNKHIKERYGKCAILGTVLDLDDIHCHHKLPKNLNGKDDYQNLIIIHKNMHKLIHATKQETIYRYLSILNPNKSDILFLKLFKNSLDCAILGPFVKSHINCMQVPICFWHC